MAGFTRIRAAPGSPPATANQPGRARHGEISNTKYGDSPHATTSEAGAGEDSGSTAKAKTKTGSRSNTQASTKTNTGRTKEAARPATGNTATGRGYAKTPAAPGGNHCSPFRYRSRHTI